MADADEQTEESEEPLEGDEGFDEEAEEHLYDDWDDLATDPEEMSRLGRTLEGLLPDIVKRSVGGLVSEDGLRSLVKDRELPREAVGFMLGQVDATKREVLRVVSKEVRLFLQNVDLGGELTKILTSVSFEIRTEVRFIPNDASIKPNVRNRVSVRGKDGSKKTIAEDEIEGEEVPLDEKTGDEESLTEGNEEGTDEEVGEAQSQGPRRRRWRLRRRNGENNEDKEDEETDEEQDED